MQELSIMHLCLEQMHLVPDKEQQLEEDILSSETMRIVDLDAYQSEMQETNEDVERVIRGRMTKKTAIAAGAIALALFFCGFFPYLTASARDGFFAGSF